MRQRHRELNPLDVAIRQGAAGGVRLVRHLHLRQQIHGFVGRVVRGAAPGVEQQAVTRQQSRLYVFAHGHRAERGGGLKGAAHAQAADLAGRQADEFTAIQLHRAGIGA
jgi:hypothetical protein